MPRITPNQSTRPTGRRTNSAFVPLIVIALLVLLAGCDTASTAGRTPPTDTAVPPTATAKATATTASSTPTPSKAIAIEDFDFNPSALSVKAGTTVTWTNTSNSTSHTVTSNTGLFDKTLAPSNTFQFKFTQTGVFHYHCKIHPSMTATITVTAS